MSKATWWGLPLAASCFLAVPGSFWAQDSKSVADKHDARMLRESLKEVINSGAELFNKYGDHAGCYRLYQGALLSIKPFLAPAMQQEISTALMEAEKLPRYSDRAFALRKTIDGIRAHTEPVPPVTDKKSGPAEDKKVAKTTLWDRLGGETKVRKIVADFIKAVAADPEVNVSRDGKFKLDDQAVQQLEKHLVDFISSATGGPLKYEGKDMKDAHKGMGITNAEFNAVGMHLKQALDRNGVKAEDVALVMKAVESLRNVVVEGKKMKTP